MCYYSRHVGPPDFMPPASRWESVYVAAIPVYNGYKLEKYPTTTVTLIYTRIRAHGDTAMRNQETLALMLEAERRDTPWVNLTLLNAEKPDHAKFDHFDECTSVVEVVKVEMEFTEACYGEIDPVNQFHYLRGPNAYDEQELAAVGWESRTEASNR